MTRYILLAGAAALTLSIPAAAEKGGKGEGKGGGKPAAAQVDRHGGGHGRAAKPDKSQHRAAKPDKSDRHVARADRPVDRVSGDRGRSGKVDRRAHGQAAVRGPDRIDDRRLSDRRRDWSPSRGDVQRIAAWDRNCPPGLAKKHNGCMPPGLAKNRFGVGDRVDRTIYSSYRLPAGYQSLYYDTQAYYYRYDNAGNLYRVDSRSNMVSGLIPLLGSSFVVGQRIPAGFASYNVPVQYRDTYYDSNDSWYRYGDDAIYQVNPQSGTIESIVALLTGDLSVGQPLPAGYDVYNLPLDYRDDYVDDQDYMYRYADGGIYQVDAKTQIIKAIVEMLV
ncbi:MAG TPA: hypothetical protein VIT45_15410 [Allosphingosinicella sp.]